MPITAIAFDSIFTTDIHVVRGATGVGETSLDLRDWLEVTPTVGNATSFSFYLQSHNDVDVLFTPLFKPQNTAGAAFQGFGISVNKKTGQVTAKGTAPAKSPANFIIEATVTKNTGGVAPATIAKAFMRVHVHQSVVRISLTPPRLTTRAAPGSGTMDVMRAFTVRAEFDDGTVGDVTESKHVNFSPTTHFDGYFIKLPASAAVGDDVHVTVKTTVPSWSCPDADGHIDVLDTWDNEPNVPMAELIEGHPKAWDATQRPEEVPNPIIVGCGFTATDQPEFETITDGMIHQIKADKMLQPYGYLATSMNYWRLMVPAPPTQPGISVRCEVSQAIDDGQLFAVPVPMPAVPPAALEKWSIEHLIYAVGLPVPADLALVKDAGSQQALASLDALRAHDPATLDFSKLFDKWTTVARPIAGVSFTDVPPKLAHEWLALADRTFVDEVDVFPAVAIGDPPAAGLARDNSMLSYHGRRGLSSEVDAFFNRVTAKPKPGLAPIALDGTPPQDALGRLWNTDPATRPAFKFDNTRFVATFSNMPYGRANAANHIHTRVYLYRFGASGDVKMIYGIPVARVAGRSTLTLALPAPAQRNSDSANYQVLAHELSHTMGLGDEYDEFGTKSPRTEANLDDYANLTTPGTFQNADGSVRVEDLKWNWHRIRKAAVLTKKKPEPVGGLFHAYMHLATGLQFAPGDKVRLRKRVRGKVIGRPTVTSAVEFTVKEVHKDNPDDPADTQNMMLVLEPDGAVDISPFDPDSLIYLPVPAPAAIATAAKPYLTLVPPAAERMMTAIGGLLNGKTCPPASAGDTAPVAPGDQDPKVAKALLPLIAGAYFTGGQYADGIAHPAGMCMMKNSSYTPSGVPKGVSAFCVVCRYALVDRVDPDKHWENDLDYDGWFPL